MHRAILKGHWDEGRDRTKCILINYRINEGGPSQVGGSYSWWGGGASALMLHLVPHPPLRYVKQHTCHGLLRWALRYPALPSASYMYITLSMICTWRAMRAMITYTMPFQHKGCVSNRHWSDLKLHSPCPDG